MVKKSKGVGGSTGISIPLSRRQSITAMAAAALLARPAAADDTVPKLIALSEEANSALVRGDADTYRALINISKDFTLMSPFGGKPSHASEYTAKTWDEIGKFFKNGTFEQELVHSYSSPDMVVLALIEKANVAVGDLPAQDWALRVTLVYQRDGSEWRLVHRHADPLSHGISVQEAAALARGLQFADNE
jgi:ketosteroid isomerase-like protein